MSDLATSVDYDAVRVMIVDDSAIIRGLYRKLIGEESDMSVVVDASNGEMAIDRLKRTEVDVVVMDIEMPVLDGVSALPGMLKVQPDVQIVMSSTLTERNAEIALRALEAGARDYIQKPTTKADVALDGNFRMQLCEKIRELGRLRRRGSKARLGAAAPSAAPSSGVAPAPKPAGPESDGWRVHTTKGADAKQYSLRAPSKVRPKVLLVGSSTGGPQALQSFFANLDRDLDLPILVVQHMPPKFTTILCGHIERASGWPCREGETGDVPKPNQVLLAPGGYHMILTGDGGPRIELNEDAPENFCRPAVDPLFRTASAFYGSATLGVILTGMGNDGSKGGKQVVDAGGTVIVQDESTSVVWGMPGAAAAVGISSAILPLEEIPGRVLMMARGMAA